MKSWSEIEQTAHMIIDPFLDPQGKAHGRLEGTQYLFDLLRLLRQSRVLKEASKTLDHLTLLLYPSDRKDKLVSIVPPGPMLNGSVEEFTVALQQLVKNDYEIVKEEKFHYQDMQALIKSIEAYFEVL